MHVMILLVTVMENYKCLCEHFLSIAKLHIDQSILAQIKQSYSTIINSNRTFENITNLEGLLQILEKRGILTYNNIKPLQYISNNFVKDKRLQEQLDEYNVQLRNIDSSTIINLYTNGKLNLKSNFEKIDHVLLNKCTRNMDEDDTIIHKKESPFLYNYSLKTEELLLNNELFLHDHSLKTLTIPITRRTSKRMYVLENYKVKRKLYCLKHTRIYFMVAIILLLLIPIMYCTLASNDWVSLPNTASVVPNTSTGILQGNVPITYRSQESWFTTQSFGIKTFNLPNKDYIKEYKDKWSEEEKIQSLVILTLSERLGRYWKDFARYLNVREFEIDDIEIEFRQNSKEKSCKVLKIFFSKSNPDNWKLKLLSALEQIKRRDLKEIVEELLSKENI